MSFGCTAYIFQPNVEYDKRIKCEQYAVDRCQNVVNTEWGVIVTLKQKTKLNSWISQLKYI